MTNLEKVSEKIKAIFPVADKLTLKTLTELKQLIDIVVAEQTPKEFNERVIEKMLWKYEKDFMVIFAVKELHFGLFAMGKDSPKRINAIQFMNLFAKAIQQTTIKQPGPTGLRLIKPN